MSHDSLPFTLDQLHALSKELRATLRDLSMEQRARYKELALQFDELATAVSDLDDAELVSRAGHLLVEFRRFQSHLQPGDTLAALVV